MWPAHLKCMSIKYRSTADTCTICLRECHRCNPYCVNGHKFHSACLTRWIRSGHLSCPVCRAQLQLRRSPRIMTKFRTALEEYRSLFPHKKFRLLVKERIAPTSDCVSVHDMHNRRIHITNVDYVAEELQLTSVTLYCDEHGIRLRDPEGDNAGAFADFGDDRVFTYEHSFWNGLVEMFWDGTRPQEPFWNTPEWSRAESKGCAVFNLGRPILLVEDL